MKVLVQFLLFILFMLFITCQSRKHKLKITDDYRSSILLTSFGLYQRGYINVNFEDFHYSPVKENSMFGFTLERIIGDTMGVNVDVSTTQCFMEEIMKEAVKETYSKHIILLKMDLKNKQLLVNCYTPMYGLYFYNDTNSIPRIFKGVNEITEIGVPQMKAKSCNNVTLPIRLNNTSSLITYSTQFTVYVPTENEEGLYILHFHNCGSDDNTVSASFNIRIEARNRLSELSAGEMSLPDMYFFMAAIFHVVACVWIYILIKSRHTIYKIHYLMAVVAVFKSASLLLHGINYHFIEKEGEHVSPWIVLYYIARLLKGFLLFATIILIGTGWTFIKHILSNKEKKIFMIVLPLQVCANIAQIVLEELEVGDPTYRLWFVIFLCIDLICCGAIIFPVIWSINHLKAASHVDGKAAINLNKLKLFRYFYVMILCYVYTTRIVALLLKMTITFQYLWLDELFKEIATLIFFILTGYKFRPTTTNPYYDALEQDDDNEMGVIVKQCGLTEGLTKLSRISNEIGDDDKDTLLIYKRDEVN